MLAFYFYAAVERVNLWFCICDRGGWCPDKAAHWFLRSGQFFMKSMIYSYNIISWKRTLMSKNSSEMAYPFGQPCWDYPIGVQKQKKHATALCSQLAWILITALILHALVYHFFLRVIRPRMIFKRPLLISARKPIKRQNYWTGGSFHCCSRPSLHVS